MLRIAIVRFADPTLLIAGGVDDIVGLADAIGRGDSLVFGDTAGAKLYGLRQFGIKTSPARSAFTLLGGEVLWEISLAERARIVSALTALSDSRTPAHAYLDPENNLSKLDVVVSIGEYDVDQILQREGGLEHGD